MPLYLILFLSISSFAGTPDPTTRWDIFCGRSLIRQKEPKPLPEVVSYVLQQCNSLLPPGFKFKDWQGFNACSPKLRKCVQCAMNQNIWEYFVRIYKTGVGRTGGFCGAQNDRFRAATYAFSLCKGPSPCGCPTGVTVDQAERELQEAETAVNTCYKALKAAHSPPSMQNQFRKVSREGQKR